MNRLFNEDLQEYLMKKVTQIKKKFKLIESQVSQLVEEKYKFESLRKYTEKNKLDKDLIFKDFLRFVAFNYRDLALINVCKQGDEDRKAVSLINLLIEVQDITVIGLSKAEIETDIRNIRKSIRGRKTKKKLSKRRNATKNSLWMYRSKRGAHHDIDPFSTDLTIERLYESVILMEKLVLKYGLLLNHSCPETLLPSNIHEFIQFSKIFNHKPLKKGLIL